jgi:pyrroloquinoline quinone biosynthesis protein B
VAALDEWVLEWLNRADVLLMDGTFWSEGEMGRMVAIRETAGDMGHLPVGGRDGSLGRVAALTARRKIYVHINNTNPMHDEDSSEALAVEMAGAEVGHDGMEFRL